MTQKIYYFCDNCEKECFPQEGLGTFVGFIVKIDEKLEKKQIGFEGHYCYKCAEKIMEFTKELKNAENNHIESVA